MGNLVVTEDGTLDVGSVSTLSREELTNWLRLRVQGGDHLVPGDVKQGEPSYHVVASIYPDLERDSRSYMRSAVEEFLSEMSHGDASWHGEAGHSLLLLAQELNEREFINPIRRMAEDSLFYDLVNGRDVDDLHRRLLQSLVALGWRGSAQFWHAQFAKSPATYAAVAFAGLNMISIRSAMELLPRVPWEDEGAKREMRVALRGLLPAYDHMFIGWELSRALSRFDPSLRPIVTTMLPEVQELALPRAIASLSDESPDRLYHLVQILRGFLPAYEHTLIGAELSRLLRTIERSRPPAGDDDTLPRGGGGASDNRTPEETEASFEPVEFTDKVDDVLQPFPRATEEAAQTILAALVPS